MNSETDAEHHRSAATMISRSLARMTGSCASTPCVCTPGCDLAQRARTHECEIGYAHMSEWLCVKQISDMQERVHVSAPRTLKKLLYYHMSLSF